MKKLKDYVSKYSYNIEYDPDDNIFIARCAELPTLAAHGDTQEKAFEEIKNVVCASLEWIEEDGESIPEPLSLQRFSGEFRVRMSPEIHRRIATEAKLQGVSMNQFILSKF